MTPGNFCAQKESRLIPVGLFQCAGYVQVDVAGDGCKPVLEITDTNAEMLCVTQRGDGTKCCRKRAKRGTKKWAE